MPGYIDFDNKTITIYDKRQEEDGTPERIDHEELLSPITIDFTPVGCQSSEGAARVTKATNEFHDATVQVANAAETMYEEMLAGGEFEDWTELSAAIQARKEKQGAFLNAVAGR